MSKEFLSKKEYKYRKLQLCITLFIGLCFILGSSIVILNKYGIMALVFTGIAVTGACMFIISCFMILLWAILKSQIDTIEKD